MTQYFLSASAVLAFAALGLSNATNESVVSSKSAEDERVTLHRAYAACSDIAAERVLSKGEVEACSLTYLRLKLSFLEDVSVKEYAAMSAAERAQAHRDGYAAYKSWSVAQLRSGPVIVAHE